MAEAIVCKVGSFVAEAIVSKVGSPSWELSGFLLLGPFKGENSFTYF